VVRAAAAPGYLDPGLPGADPSLPRGGGDAGTDFGYTPALRLRFLREHGFDPIDLDLPVSVTGDLSLPFFPRTEPLVTIRIEDGRRVPDPATAAAFSPARAWEALRHETNRRLLEAVHRAFTRAHPNMPLLIRTQAVQPSQVAHWYGTWDRGDAPPRYVSSDTENTAQTARTFSGRVLKGFTYQGLHYYEARNDRPESVASWLATLATTPGGNDATDKNAWDGLVLNLSETTVAAGKALLDAFDPPAA
jgi:hypothetical protein